MAKLAGTNPDTLLTEILDIATRGARRIAFAHGWRRVTICMLAGVLAALALAPFYAIPGVLLGVTLLIWVIDGLDEGLKGAFEALLAGAAFGLGFFGVALYGFWLSSVEGLVLLAWASLFPAFAVLTAHRFWTVGPERGLTLAIVLTASEWCRGHFFGGLPLALTGAMWAELPYMLQITAWIGVYGLSLVTLAAASAVAGCLPNPSFSHNAAGHKPHLTLWWLSVALGVVLLIFFFGLWRVSGVGVSSANDIFVRIVTTPEGVCDIDPEDLRREPALSGDDLVYEEFSILIVPGPACGTGFLSEQAGGTEIVSAWIEKDQVAVVQSARRARLGGIYDALHVIDSDGEIRATYDRSHGLPFGLAQQHPLHPDAAIFLGAGPRTYAPSDVPEFSLLLGVDVTASGNVVDRTKRPAWLLSLSDDRNALPGARKQFVDAARLRAVEEGLPVVRAAAGRPSVVFDAYGRKTTGREAQQSGVLDLALPVPLTSTIYSKIGDLAVLLALLSAGGLAYGISRWRLPSIRAA